MALGSTNITTAAANIEMGSPLTFPRNFSALCGYTGQNQYSFRGNGNLKVDSNKIVSIDYTTMPPYKLGDFRLYNHSASTPIPQANYVQKWGPGGATVDFSISVTPYEMNILNAASAYSSSALRWCFKIYTSSASRITGTSPIQTIYSAITWNSVSLSGHTRTQTQQAGSTQVVSLTGVSTSYSTLYVDTYVSDISGNRLVTLGTSIASGYTDITMTESLYPTLDGGAFVTPVPTGYTNMFPIIHSASTPVCTDSILTQTNGDTTYDFYLAMKGVYGTGTRIPLIDDCTISLKVGGSSAVIVSSTALAYASKNHFTGTIPSGLSGGNFSYDEVWTVEVSNITYGLSLFYTSC